MKSRKLSIAVATGLLFAGLSAGAFADDKWLGESGSNWQEHIQSTKTRAEVTAELNQAHAQGLHTMGTEASDLNPPAATSGASAADRTQAGIGANAWTDSIYFGD